nr:hypothetical protein [Tanacetum cinerariifolium]
MIQPEPEGSTQRYPLVSVEVLRYDKRSKSKNMGIVSTEMELILKHTQQGISHEVSVDPHGFAGYSNQTQANDKAVRPTALLLTVSMQDT